MNVHWTQAAVQDLVDAVDFLAGEGPEAAPRVLENVLAAVDTLRDGRFDGPEVELTTGERVRRWVVRPYSIIYLRVEDALVVLRVYHGRREPIVR